MICLSSLIYVESLPIAPNKNIQSLTANSDESKPIGWTSILGYSLLRISTWLAGARSTTSFTDDASAPYSALSFAN